MTLPRTERGRQALCRMARLTALRVLGVSVRELAVLEAVTPSTIYVLLHRYERLAKTVAYEGRMKE